MDKILPPDLRELHREYADDLQKMMKEYRKKEKEIKDGEKKGKTTIGTGSTKTGMIDGPCPFCGEPLGKKKDDEKLPKPTRRSKRKCRSCSETIIVDPCPSCYKGPFLTEYQGVAPS